jgi:hypothetical protein
MEVSMMAIGRRTTNMERDVYSGQMEIVMMENSVMIRYMGVESIIIQMAFNIKEIFTKAKNKGMECR